MAVAERLRCRVHVDDGRKKGMLCFDWPTSQLDSLTTNAKDSALWVRPMRDLNFNAMRKMKASRESASGKPCKKVVAFQPTGWSFQGKNSGENTSTKKSRMSEKVSAPSLLKERKNGPDSIYSLPYSEHSSFTELLDFLRTFRPSTVIPTVNTHKDKVKAQLSLLKSASGVY